MVLWPGGWLERASGLEELRGPRGGGGGPRLPLSGWGFSKPEEALPHHPLSHPAPPKQNKKGHVIAKPNESPGSGSGRAAGGAPARASRARVAPRSRPATPASRAPPRPAPTTDGALRLEGEVLNLEGLSRREGTTQPGGREVSPAGPRPGIHRQGHGPSNTTVARFAATSRLRGFAASDPGDLDSRKAGSSPGRRRTAAVRSRKPCSAR